MAKLTETTNDKLKEEKRRGRPPGSKNKVSSGNGLHIVEAHEPLPNEPWTATPENIATLTGYVGNIQQIPVKYTPTAPPSAAPIPQVPPVAPVAAVQPLKIALIGTAPSSRMLAPYNDPTWKIWACSPGNMNQLPRVDVWFEIHGSLLWPENQSYGPQYIEWLKKQTFPIYMQDKRYLDNALELPVEKLVKEFGPHCWTSSFSWMMGMAIMSGAKEIALYGIDMASRDEYILQRQAAYHFIFVECPKRGIKIGAPYESDIMQPPALYGFSETTPLGRKQLARKAELSERLAQKRSQRAALDHEITYLEGAFEDLDYHISIWGGVQNNSGLKYLDKP